jgi:hypothetical protein
MSKNTNLSFLTDFLTADIVNSRVGMNNVSPQATFDVTGTGKFSGILTLGSTVSNGTYTYTLPSATGTLALTSDIPSVSGYVPYTGATQAVNLGFNQLLASTLTINGDSLTGGSYLGFKHSTNVTTGADGYTSIYTFGTNTIGFKSISGATTKDFSFSMASITPGVPGGRIYTLPDADGTIALTSDLSSYVTLGTAQSITGVKTFNSGSLILAGNGTASPTIIRNTSGTTGSTGGFNTIGFNSNNNIFVDTTNSGGFIFDFNNSVSNRTYTLQDSSGTLAFTSQIPTVAGVYLPLAGGTLTGALNGTSASFSGAISLLGTTLPSAGTARLFSRSSDNSTYLQSGSGNTINFLDGSQNTLASFASTSILLSISNAPVFTLASTGAATFSNIVNVGYDSNNRSTIRLTSNAANRQAAIYFYGNNVESAVLGYEGGSEVVSGGVQGDFVIRNVLANKNIILATNNGKVGIGTTTPDNSYQGLTISGTDPSLRIKTTSGSGWVWTEYVTAAGVNNFSMGVNQTQPYFGIKAGAGLDNPNFAMTPSGNVLIGTITDGGRKLEIQTSSTNAALWVQTGGTTSSYVIADFRTGTNLPALQILGNGASFFGSSTVIQSGNSLFVNNASNTRSGYLKTSSDGTELSSFAGAGEPLILIAPDTVATMRFYTGGSTVANERMRITSGGNLLIGTTTSTTLGGFTDTRVLIKQITDGVTGGGLQIEQNSTDNVAYFGFTGSAFKIGTSYRSAGSYQPILIEATPGSNQIVLTATSGRVLMGSTVDQGNWKAQVTGNMFVRGSSATSAETALYMDNSNGITLFSVRNDGFINSGTASVSPYNNSTSGRNMVIESSGGLGYLVSTRESKSNIKSIQNIDFLNQLNPVQFNYRKKDNKNNTFTDELYENINYGFIADEVEKVNKELVFYNQDGTLAGVEYNNMIAILTKAIQEQQKQIEELKNKLS